jgi:tRNA (Thr-GGU) A37 N-methylase
VTADICYRPIGVVECPISEPLRPEVIRAEESHLVLDPRYAPAIRAIEIGQHLLVVYHLHRAGEWQDRHVDALFTRRFPSRPNPIGVTLTRVVALHDSKITVVGLDAIDGSPILDVKPFKPVYDTPPVHPADRPPSRPADPEGSPLQLARGRKNARP